MTLFVSMPGRRYEITDAYVMALAFCLFFIIGIITKKVIKRQCIKEQKNAKQIKMYNPRAESLELPFYDNNKLAETILVCIADNENYFAKNPKKKITNGNGGT